MLHLASKAFVELLYPMTWAGIFIPVLPARLIQALEAPCPYIVGIERRYENVELPEDDFVLVDLDQDEIESTTPPTPMPKQQRRKLTSLLQVAAPHHNRYGVPKGPPAYAIESYPHDMFSSENASIFSGFPQPTSLAKYTSLNSTSFGENAPGSTLQPPLFNAFLPSSIIRTTIERPSTSRSTKASSPPSPTQSPMSQSFPPPPVTPISRGDSSLSIQSTLREKRSGQFDNLSKRSSTYAPERHPTTRRPSMPLNGHSSNHSSSLSMATMSDGNAYSNYAPSTYAQSTLAASTIMPNILMQPVRNNDTTQWMEGHCLQWRTRDERSTCSICEEKADGGIYKCTGCPINVHGRCIQQVCLPCPSAFHPEQVRAAFVRCFASLFYTYRKFLGPPTSDQKKSGMLYRFNMDGFLRSLPHENADYVQMLRQTQGRLAVSESVKHFLTRIAFNEFIHERESNGPNDPSIMLFDQIILSKRNRGRTSIFSKSKTDFLSDTADHLWRTAAANPPKGKFPGDYRATVTRSKSLDLPILFSYSADKSIYSSCKTRPHTHERAPSLPGCSSNKYR